MFRNRILTLVIAVIPLMLPRSASAQCLPLIAGHCTIIDFEDFAVDTTITNQYPGVTFSLVPQSCGGVPTLYPVVTDPSGQTCSGTRALTPQAGCPEFNPDYIRMVFDELQSDVSFCIGEDTYTIRAYSTSSGAAGLLNTQTVSFTSGGFGTLDVLRTVRVTSVLTNIRRIEVQAGTDNQEFIDDVAFGNDTTPPDAQITDPPEDSCLCSGLYVVSGISCDGDGHLYVDRLQYRALGAANWIQIQSDTLELPVCTVPSNLYTWNTVLVPHGEYELRLTSTNLCGCESVDEIRVWVDKLFGNVTIAEPSLNEFVGGESVCISGTVADDPDRCFGNYTVQYRPASGGVYVNVMPGPANANAPVYGNALASWDTAPPGAFVADGSYTIRVTGTDSCGNSASATRNVTIDNTPPVAIITSPSNCQSVQGIVQIIGTASDANLSSWTLDYTGGIANGWVPIAAGNMNVIEGALANWDTSGLARCCHTIRLRVNDKSTVNCHYGPNYSEYYVSVSVGSCCDINLDGFGDGADVQPFVNCLLTGNCP
jgi:hypothetical protein